MAETLREKSVRGGIWSAVERFSLTSVQFVIQIVLARLLTPHDYGLIGMLAVFLAISQIFVDSGFTSALVQNQNRTERDFSTTFFFNIFVSLVCYGVLFAFAPIIANFYEMPVLTNVMRIIGLSLVFSAISGVHRAKLTIDVDFKTQAKASLSAALISGGIGIMMAQMGYGVWALVAQTLVNTGLTTLFLIILLRWKPSSFFSLESFRPMFSFGSKILGASLLHTVYTNLYSLVVGKAFSASALGFFSRAEQLASFPSSMLIGILGRVTFPVLSQVQDDDARLSDIYRRYLRFLVSVVVPVELGIAAVAYPLIAVVLGEQWLPTVPLLQILCLAWALDPITAINLNLLYVKGRTDLVLRLEIIKKTTAIAILFASLPFGLIGLCVGRSLYSAIALLMNTYYTGKFLKMNLWMQIKEVASIFIVGFVMAGVAWVVTLLFKSQIHALIVSICVGTIIYLGFSYWLKFEFWQEGKSILTKLFHV